ncbi:CoA transferase [Nocardia sp. CA-129566]|uniref:CoA transferase n=1 Tax=Nocardia sp. CA-129566 TaxID=3239976 RepID=UPI003D97EC65
MSETQANTHRPLAGLRVIELSSFVAAPLGGMTLAQLGAEVIRIDPIGGGPDRDRWPRTAAGRSLYWSGLNKGKKSLTIDMKSEPGREIVRNLLRTDGPSSGILLTNAVGRSWLGYEELRTLREDAIVVRVEGNWKGQAAVDYTVNAAVGFPMVTGPDGFSDPINHVLPAWDVTCGIYSSLAITTAVLNRQATGQGAHVRIALEDVALATAGNLGLLSEAQINESGRPRIGNHLYGGFARDFTTLDGHKLMVVALTKRHWADLLDVTGQKQVVTALEKSLGVDFTREDDRYAYREALAGLFQVWFESHSTHDAEAALQQTSLLWARYRSFDEVVDPASTDVWNNPMLSMLTQPGIPTHLAPGSPIRFNDLPRTAEPAPELGAHNREILTTLMGFGDRELGELERKGVIGDTSC